MALSTHEILHLLERNAAVVRRYGVRSLGLFGSGARGTPREESDLDFVVEFETKSFDAYMDRRAFIEGLFGCRVDLVLPADLRAREPGAARGGKTWTTHRFQGSDTS